MRLTRYTDYSLRLLMYLALKPDELCTIKEIAEHYRISENHLMKIAHQLGVAGDIDTVRGRGGGLRLAKSPEAINVGAVARRAEQDSALVECFKPEANLCVLTPACVLKGVLGKAEERFYEELDQVTLADLVKPQLRLKKALALPTG